MNQRRWLASNVPLSCCGQRPRSSCRRACQCATLGTLTSTAPPGRQKRGRPRQAGGRVGQVLEHVGEHDEVEGGRLERQAGILQRALHDVVADLRRRARGGRRQLEAGEVPGAGAQQREQAAGGAADVEHAAGRRQQAGGVRGDRAVAEGGVRLRLGLVELREGGIAGHRSERTGHR